MAASSSVHHLPKVITIFLIIITLLTTQTKADCESESHDSCNNKSKALPLKIIAIFSILATSMIGICLPLFTKSVPALSPENDLFIIVKCFAAGIILGTGFMHVLPDSFDMLWSDCLKEKPWHEFPFSGLVAMFSALITLMIDSLATSIYSKKCISGVIPESSNHPSPATAAEGDQEMATVNLGHFHGHQHHNHQLKTDTGGAQLLRYRVIAMVLELGIIVHSVVIGLGMGASNNTCSIKGLIAAMCFHQMFEGMGLGGCILQAEFKFLKKAVMAFFFSVTTPFGIALGIAISSSYKENSPTALITVGLLNAASAGLLIYMALCDLLSADFMGPRLQSSIKLQIKSYIAVFLGAGGMSLMARWA